MKSTVWKFPLEFTDKVQTIKVPIGSKVVHVHEQDDRVCVWVEVEVKLAGAGQPSEMRLLLVPTGEEFVSYDRRPAGDWANAGEISTYAYHRGTAHVGWTVWHVYQLQGQYEPS